MERPFILRGNVKVTIGDYIIGSVVKNNNVEEKEEYIQIIDREHKNEYQEGYLGYIFVDFIPAEKENIKNYATDVKSVETLITYDVIEMVNGNYIKVLYRDDSEDNFIQLTNQCNSNCIMCPDSEQIRNTDIIPDIEKIKRQISRIPDDTKNLCITGGEPGILKYDLIEILKVCKEKLPDTNFLLLTNGRVFSDFNYTNEFVKNLPPNIRLGIPLYADNSKQHDEITNCKGSFDETVKGIKYLLEKNVDIEIRIVVMKKNYKYLEKIAKYISEEFATVEMVNFMALEMMGNAYKNRKQVWIDFEQAGTKLYDAIITLAQNGIPSNIYNFPLCKVDKRLYSLVRKSISDYKVRYKPICDECKLKQYCGGLFFSTINMSDIGIQAVK